MNDYLIPYLLIVNAAALLLMLSDKLKARKNVWRIPEATLLTVAALGGSLGTLTGMHLFRHKTRKPKFYIGVPVLLAAHILLLIFLFSR